MSEPVINIWPESPGTLSFWCQGCEEIHSIPFADPLSGVNWQYNGDRVNPTTTPSILITGCRMPTDGEIDRIMAGEKGLRRPFRCHLYLTNGYLEYCPDSSHWLAGQTVKMNPV